MNNIQLHLTCGQKKAESRIYVALLILVEFTSKLCDCQCNLIKQCMISLSQTKITSLICSSYWYVVAWSWHRTTHMWPVISSDLLCHDILIKGGQVKDVILVRFDFIVWTILVSLLLSFLWCYWCLIFTFYYILIHFITFSTALLIIYLLLHFNELFLHLILHIILSNIIPVTLQLSPTRHNSADSVTLLRR